MQAEDQAEQVRLGPRAGLWLGLACLAAGLLLTWGFGRSWTGSVASSHGEVLDAEWELLARWSGGLAGLTLAALGWLLWRGCRGTKGRVNEWLPTGVVIVLVAFGVRGLRQLPSAPPAPGGAYEVEVSGQQFEWLVRYPGPDGIFGRVKAELVHSNRNPLGLDASDPAAQDDIFLRSQLRLPLGKPCIVHLRSLDVLHSFNLEDFRVRRDLMPGYPTRVEFTPTKAGEYELSCAALCGLGHYRMSAKVHVLAPDELQRWLDTKESWL